MGPPSQGRSSPSPGPGRRPRAPTITIDTSAVARSSEDIAEMGFQRQDHVNDGYLDDGRPSLDRSAKSRPSLTITSTSELRGSNSFDSRESRPTSPHNVSSPTRWVNPHGLLEVPSKRSRGGSIDTEAESSASGTTYVNSQAPTVDGGSSKAFADHMRADAGDQRVLPDDEALLPDGTEQNEPFEVENNPFAFAPGQLSKLLNPKSLGALHALGGLRGFEKGLRSDRDTGLSVDESQLEGFVTFEEATGESSPQSDTTLVGQHTDEPTKQPTNDKGHPSGTYADRKRVFDTNHLPERKTKNVLQLMWMAYNDKVLIVLTVAAVIALALGLYQALGTPEGGVEWIEGVAIIVAIVVVVLVGAINDWQKERQFAKLNKKKDDRNVKVFRSGKRQEISVHDILVGEVLVVEQGDILPVDGIYIDGHGVKCDESSATGESDILKKTPAVQAYHAMETNEDLKKIDPFMISGAKVTEGYGRMMVTAVGTHSSYGKTMLSLQDENDMTPLQGKLNKMAEYIAKIGSAAALLLFVVLLIEFLAELHNNHGTPTEKAQDFLTILITAVTIVVVAVPEGLPLAVTLALAYATKRMLKDRNLVRVLRSCETMGNATSICSDKTGTLTQNVMTVVAGSIGTASRFSSRPTRDSSDDVSPPTDSSPPDMPAPLDDVPTAECIRSLAEPVKTLWKDSIAINSTAFPAEDEGKPVFVGSKTETALLDFVRDFLDMDDVTLERSNAEIVQMLPFDSKRKCMAVVIKRQDRKGYRLMVKGASEILLKYCTGILRDPTQGVEVSPLSDDNGQSLAGLINAYASRSLRTIGFIYRDIDADTWPPRGVKRSTDDPSQAVFAEICKQMIFLGLVGIQDPLREGVREAVRDCIMAGVVPRMVTGDNILTAKAIATECGIYTSGIVMEGPEFRKMSQREQWEIIPKLQVLARSSPDDKRILVKRLKERGETVAVTGDGTNDAPALKAADVGFSMNIAGTEVAKEASDIILMDDNFASIVKALMWGRAVNDAVRKFLQFQITVNITAVLLAFISAVANSQQQSVLSAVQLLWVNLIMDTMAALALATDPPNRNILNRKPDPKSAPLISVNMWKMIIGQAIYQLVVTLVLYFAGASIFGLHTRYQQRQLQTLVFNTFVWMQIFNALNNRRLDNRFNIFEGLTKNWFFIGIFAIMIGGQVIIVFFGGWDAFQAEHQTGWQWAVALILGVISLPIGIIIRLIPDELVVRIVPPFIRDWAASRRKDPIVITDEEAQIADFDHARMEIRDELAFLKKFKGGRLNALRFTLTHPKQAFSRSPSRGRSSRGGSTSLPRTPNNELADHSEYSSQTHLSAPPTPESRRRRGRSHSNSMQTGAAIAGIVASSFVLGRSPVDHRSDGESFRSASRNRSRSDLSHDTRVEPQLENDTERLRERDSSERDGE